MADLEVPVHDPETVRRITESVLSRPELADARPSWWDEVTRTISELLDRVLGTVGSGGRGSVIGTLVLLAIGAALALALVRFGRTMGTDPSVDLAVAGPVGRSSRDWLDDAERHEQAQQWRDALRCRYRALVAELAAHGLVEEVPGRTTGEYLSAVSGDVPAATAPFTRATRRFEQAWYGHAEVGSADAEDFAVSAGEVLRAAGVTVAGARR